jgi:hypothetical protein
MDAHAAIAFRGTDTRGPLALPVELGRPDWVYDFLPDRYFYKGKAETVLASLALDSVPVRPFVGTGNDPGRWSGEGEAWVLYLGSQWRPDPACGLIVLAAAQAKGRGLPLVVVWPRVFSAHSDARERLFEALHRFKRRQDGPLAAEMARHGRAHQISSFARRVSTSAKQFGIFTPGSKIGRVLLDTAEAAVFGDVVATFGR